MFIIAPDSRGWYKAKVGISSCPSGIRCTRIYRNFFILLVMGFFSKKHPPWPIFVFENTRVPPLDLKKYFFWNRLKSFFYQSHWIAFGLTIPKWYDTWVSEIFLGNIFLKNIFKNIFFKNIYKNIFNTQVSYHFGILRPIPIKWLCWKNDFGRFEKKYFSKSKGGGLWICKNGFCSAGG